MTEPRIEIVTIESEAIVIRLPFAQLQAAVENFPGLEFHDPVRREFIKPKITDIPVFSIEVLRSLLAEDEDGSTLVTKMFDRAFNNAIENGADGIWMPEDEGKPL